MANWKVRAALQGFASWLSIAKFKANPTIEYLELLILPHCCQCMVFLFCSWKLTTNLQLESGLH